MAISLTLVNGNQLGRLRYETVISSDLLLVYRFEMLQ